MKASELRIGNLVYENNIFVIIHDGFGIDHAKQFTPIPLTEEWFRKLGFDKEENHFQRGRIFFQFSLPNFQLKLNALIEEWGDARIAFADPNISIQHVHQLQNLYFALTGAELTIQK